MLDRLLLKKRYFISMIYIVASLCFLDRLVLPEEWMITFLYVFAIYGLLFLLAFEPQRCFGQLNKRPSISIVPLTLSLITFSYGCVILQTELLGWSWLAEDDSNQKYSNIPYFISDVFIFVFMAPVVEEMFFRQWLYEKLNIGMKPFFSIIVVALIFSIVHVDLIGSFIFSIVLSLYYINSRSLVNNIFIHAFFNGFLLVFQFLIDNYFITDLDTLASVFLVKNYLVLIILIVSSSISIYWLTKQYAINMTKN